MKTQADLLNFRVAELLTFRLPKTEGPRLAKPGSDPLVYVLSLHRNLERRPN
jgi:hypothetical protein